MPFTFIFFFYLLFEFYNQHIILYVQRTYKLRNMWLFYHFFLASGFCGILRKNFHDSSVLHNLLMCSGTFTVSLFPFKSVIQLEFRWVQGMRWNYSFPHTYQIPASCHKTINLIINNFTHCLKHHLYSILSLPKKSKFLFN